MVIISKNITLITSVIHTPDVALSYSATRSVYTSQERFEQTKKTISTIREKIPENKIILVECSRLTDKETAYLKSKTDIFLNIMDTNDNTLINRMFTPSKSMGEGTMTTYALEYLCKKNIEFRNLFKVTGRYWLNDNFVYSNYENDIPLVRCIENSKSNIVTSLYKLPYKYIHDFHVFLKNTEEDFHKCVGYEMVFAKFIQTIDNVIYIENLGCSGNVSVCGGLIEA
jgi:hypothetical protein